MTDGKKRVLIIHGPNLNLLGKREPHVYGSKTLDQINFDLTEMAEKYNIEVEILQSNHEGVLIDAVQSADDKFSCIIMNPAAFTHYSIALRDAVAAISVPVIEVHLSNIYAREEFRNSSVIAPVSRGQISGLGPYGYILALQAAVCLFCGGK